MTYKLCALIPTYNHHTRIAEIVADLAGRNIPVLIVDDGSNLATQDALLQLTHAQVKRLPQNGGKGAAVEEGFRWAASLGYTHAFQIDADGQHNSENIQEFIELSQRNPQALISGKPVYDSSMPLGRRIGRWFTHFWVWVETLSFSITDSMCGYRIYPVQSALDVLERHRIGRRMDFDTEIMVRMYWQGAPVLMHPVRVTYPDDNTSNFDVLADNWRITKMHTRLVFAMLWRTRSGASWSHMAERGSAWGISFLALSYRLLGRTICTIVATPVVLYFFLTGRTQRRASYDFLTRAYGRKVGFIDSISHFMNFFQMSLDKIAAWSGHVDFSAVDFAHKDDVARMMTSGKGGVMLVSHLGNMEFCRAISLGHLQKQIHVLLHHKNSRYFSGVMKRLSPLSNMNIIEVTEVGPDTIIYLRERILAGDWVVIAADRTPVKEAARVVRVPFMGKEAAFAQGPYILASLLQCPVYTAIAVRNGGRYKVFIEPFAEKIALPRESRVSEIIDYATRYACVLEKYALAYPKQWYNFFDFWA